MARVLLCLVFVILLVGPSSALALGNLLPSLSNMLYTLLYLPPSLLKFLSEIVEFSNDELRDSVVKNDEEFDFIIVGAGSAGAVLAARLTEENVKVLLIEAGGNENKVHQVPLACPFLQLFGVNWDRRGEPSDRYCTGLVGNECRFPGGKVMGGSSTINAMLAMRGNRADYDSWAALGNEGWSYDEVLPYFKKLETNTATTGPGYDRSYRGSTGPITLSYTYNSKVAKAFIKAGEERGFPVRDYNGKDQIGYAEMQVNIKDGERVSTNRGYLHPIKDRKNLVVSMNSQVTKVNIDPRTKEATGVTFIKDGREVRARAKREVIVSAGALHSPQLLMISGVGPSSHLREFGIDVVKDSPGVGQNLNDHANFLGLNFLINSPDTIVTVELLYPWKPDLADYLYKKKGPLASVGVEAIGFFNTDNMSDRSGMPNMELLYVDASTVFDDPFYHHILGVKQSIFNKMWSKYYLRPAFQILPVLLKPKSTGKILLKSDSIQDPPKIIINFYDHPDDVKTMIKGIKEAIALTRTKALQRFGATLVPEPITGCEKFTMFSDEYWECGIRTLTGSFWHFSGTNKMGPRSDPKAVVDNRLRVSILK